jgi:hypothetical protein
MAEKRSNEKESNQSNFFMNIINVLDAIEKQQLLDQENEKM